MAFDVETLLQPVSESEPAGGDLSYDPDFRRISRELEDAAQKERPGDDPNVAPALQTAVTLLGRSKDFWIASHGVCFAVYAADLDAAGGLVSVMAGLAEQYWETAHPVLEEGSDPAGGRREACRQIASVGRVVKHLERMYLPPLRTKGKISFKDIAGGADPEATAAQILAQMPEPIRRAIDETGEAEWAALGGQLGAIEAAVTRLANAFATQTPGLEPDLSPLSAMLKRMRLFAEAVVARKNPAAAAAASGSDEAAAANAPAAGPAFSGPVATREQALAQLDAVKAFFQATEPSSPIPMLIDRVKRLAGMDFLQLIENLAPGGSSEAVAVLQPVNPDAQDE